MSFIRKRNSRKKPTWIHRPSDYGIDIYFWLYLPNAGYWLTRFFNLPLLLVILLLCFFLLYGFSIYPLSLRLFASFVGLEEAWAITKINLKSATDREFVMLLFVLIIGGAAAFVSFIKLARVKKNKSGFFSLMNQDRN